MFSEFLSDQKKEFFNKTNIVYHYCSCESFEKIISNKKIWLSHYASMNDFKEIKLFDYLVQSCIKNKRKFSLLIKEYLQKIEQKEPEYYFFCLSYAGDLLSNWVKYANDGKGFAIGYDKSYFEKVCDDMSDPIKTRLLSLNPIKYISEHDVSFIQRIIDDFEKSIKAERDTFHRNYTIKPLLINELLEYRNFVKDVGFEEEQECRLALTVTNDLSMQKQMNDKLKLSFRAKSSALVPYYALDVNAEDSIKEIVIGPKNSSRDKDIKEFVSQFYSPNITIRRSAISYR